MNSKKNDTIDVGVLGQTAVAHRVISRREADFESSTLFTTDAKTNKYLSSSVDCSSY